jgi:hypothetical protein
VSAAEAFASYEALLAHAELELELTAGARLSELDGLASRWEELIAELPERPPAAAAPVLARARLVHERTRIELMRLRDGLLDELTAAAHAKRTAEGYAVVAARPAVSALDRTA